MFIGIDTPGPSGSLKGGASPEPPSICNEQFPSQAEFMLRNLDPDSNEE